LSSKCIFGCVTNFVESLCKPSEAVCTDSVAWVRQWTIPIERPPLVGEVRTGTATFFSSSSSVVLTRLSGPRSKPTTSQKIW
jgi:hypothetical protein